MSEPPADLPREHVIRPRPPWRRGVDMTECGLLVEPGRPVITRGEFGAKVEFDQLLAGLAETVRMDELRRRRARRARGA